jgi:nitronate monooxygenase
MTRQGENAAIRRLSIALPVVQGPFGGGLSTTLLAATVSNLGGLGSYGAHSLAPEAIGPVVAEIRSQTSQPFAINLWVSDHDPGGETLGPAEFERVWPMFAPYYRELGVEKPEPPRELHPAFEAQLEAVLDARPPVFSFVFGVPSAGVLRACRERDIVTIGAATTLAEAQALEDAGVDLIVATGAEAGGHRPSFLASAEESLCGTLPLVQVVSAHVRAPVIAAGGIVDARGVRAALELGADAAQLGTAFLACAESGTTDLHRGALFSERARRTTLTRSFTGRLARGIRNRWTEEMGPHRAELPPFPITSWFVSRLRPAAVAAGRDDLISLWCGQAAPNLRHRSATELMQTVVAEL